MTGYQRTKSIRFKLVPEYVNDLQPVEKNTEAVDVPEFVSSLRETIEESKRVFFKDSKNQNLSFRPDVEFKYRFLRSEMKQEYYQLPRQKTYKLSKHQNICLNTFIVAFDQVEQVCEQMALFICAEKHSRQRRESIASQLRILKKKSNFDFIFKALSNVQCKKYTKGILDQYIKLREDLELLSQVYLSSDSEGIVLARGSFNYYTINKSSKGLDEEFEQLHDTGEYDLDKLKKSIKYVDYFSYNKSYKKIYDDIASKYCRRFSKDCKIHRTAIRNIICQNIVLQEALYKHLKDIKAFYKQSLYELSSQGVLYETIKLLTIQDFFAIYKKSISKDSQWYRYKQVFDIIARSKPYQNLKKEHYDILLEYGDLLNKASQKNESKIAKERGKVFYIGGGEKKEKSKKKEESKKNLKCDSVFKKLCEIHQAVALEYGRLKAKKKAIERERVESDLLKYWTIIAEEDCQKYLILVPREKSGELYHYLRNQDSSDQKSRIYFFESLTYQALEKLCFKGSNTGQRNTLNTFWASLEDQLPDEFKKINRLTKPEKNHSQVSYPKSDKKTIEFFKAVLNTDYAQKVLVFPSSMSSIVNFAGISLKEFQTEFSKIGYKREVRSIISLKDLYEMYNAEIFKITSTDLEKGIEKKEHTKNWNQFWSNTNKEDSYPIRLNPEISIAFRQPRKDHAYGEMSNLYNSNWKNRYRDSQYILRTTFTNNALGKHFETSFKSKDEIKTEISYFNSQLTKKDNVIGIDLGTKELATLALINTNKKPQIFEAYKVKNGMLGYKQEGFIKGGKGKKNYHLIQNFSYYTNKDLYNKTFIDNSSFDDLHSKIFEKVNISALDLTTAKVINGCIYLEGDIQSIFNLKILDIKRRVVKALHEKKQVEVFIQKRKEHEELLVRELVSEKEIARFRYREEFNALPIIKSWQFENSYSLGGLQLTGLDKPISVFQYVKSYLKAFIQEKSTESVIIEKINNYRNSISANAVGVIHALYKEYNSYVTFENFDVEKNNADKDTQFEGAIYNLLVEKVLHKFYHLGEVPPLKSLYDIKEVHKNNKKYFEQFGAILFVNESETSMLCPKCERKAYNSSSCSCYNEDKKGGRFRCRCGFDNKDNAGEYDSLDTNDKVAAFNIAKRGFDLLNEK